MVGIATLLRRVVYGGRKGRSAYRRLRRGVVYSHSVTGERLTFRLLPIWDAPSSCKEGGRDG